MKVRTSLQGDIDAYRKTLKYIRKLTVSHKALQMSFGVCLNEDTSKLPSNFAVRGFKLYFEGWDAIRAEKDLVWRHFVINVLQS